ncbi:helix-turn-helix domain-containing protein [Treponema sp.]|uniref:helix-turn-helix domain-containing protein n=1 Tax=Treponema sp. TaxID=166 RepID=UPI003890C135
MDLLSELKLRSISINECSKRTGIPYGALYPLVKGEKKIEKCEYATLKKLSDFFSCSIEDLFSTIEDFSVYWEDEKTADVIFSESQAQITRYTTNPVKQIFSKDTLSLFELGEILKWRCWDENRENIEKYLFKLGLTEFNPYKICRKTHGVMFQDKIWFKYKGENLSWDDVKCS